MLHQSWVITNLPFLRSVSTSRGPSYKIGTLAVKYCSAKCEEWSHNFPRIASLSRPPLVSYLRHKLSQLKNWLVSIWWSRSNTWSTSHWITIKSPLNPINPWKVFQKSSIGSAAILNLLKTCVAWSLCSTSRNTKKNDPILNQGFWGGDGLVNHSTQTTQPIKRCSQQATSWLLQSLSHWLSAKPIDSTRQPWLINPWTV